ncbi:MBL fold metallo-hydrolase [Frankia sp. CNm7]|uniref:MBL fold metallo-hydrolase n=1 Tax=Frankia nepalensis TaxID=1836974 RepID=A0A937RPQ7_9ACTN|nr:MBL fold metallo-hydrolase [Frankia nepalensis]MBL7514906.1 MBL fold metallo-hydrolase [Frankia nepalensis]MBL7524318.1 MBL fold metallo-hydrolase [Frankia nepalensis]MBL7631134.1 MBL fold metallo-hydrolase [Frankia nepalensis]
MGPDAAARRPREVNPLAAVVLAPNPGPMTLEGTNSWVLRAPGHTGCVVVDPGPDEPEHLAALGAAGPVATILLTHGHPDHSEGAAALHELTGAPVRALDPTHRLGSEGLVEGDVVAAAGIELRVLATPGHSADSLSFLLFGEVPAVPAADGAAVAVLTGDTILGRGTTVVAHPDGRLADYLTSLRRLAELPTGLAVLPGHGPELSDARGAATYYLAHRAQRLDQVRAALAAAGVGPEQASPRAVVERVYADVDQVLWPAAELSVRAQLDYLREQG